jgi:putative peptidoglycan lipid II flippase
MTLSQIRRRLAHRLPLSLRTLAVIGGIGLLCKAAALGRELLIASRFGASHQLDAFLVAVIVPMTIANVVGTVLATSLLPQLLRVRQQSGPAAEVRAQQTGLGWAIVAITVVSILCAAAGPWLIPWLSPGFSDESRRMAVRLLWAATPYGVMAGATRLFAVLAESEGRFARTSFSPLWTAVLSVVVLSLGGASPMTLVVGLSLGTAVELVFNAMTLRGTRYRALPAAGRFSDFERTLFAAAWPVSLGALLHGLTTIVDQSMASLAGPGAVSELTYGNRFVAVVIGLVGTPLFQLAFPRFAKLAAEQQFAEMRRQFRRFALVALAVSLPPMIVLSGLSAFVIEATFQRGRFTADTATNVALVQALGALQIPFAIVAMLGLRAVFALKLRHVMLYQGAGTVTANLVLDYLLVKWLGVPGIALGTTIVAAGTCGFMLLVVDRATRSRSGEPIWIADQKRTAA